MTKMDRETYKKNLEEALHRYDAYISDDLIEKFLDLNFHEYSELRDWSFINFDDFASSILQAIDDNESFWTVVDDYGLDSPRLEPTDIPVNRLVEIIDNVICWGIEHNRKFVQCMIDAMDLNEEEIEAFELEEYIEEEDE